MSGGNPAETIERLAFRRSSLHRSRTGVAPAMTGMDVFKTPTIEVDEAMVWDLAAMCVSHLKAKGCYHMPAGPDGDLNVFVALIDVRSEEK